MSRLAYKADERSLLTVNGTTLVAWDAATLERTWTMPFDAPLFAIAQVPSSTLPRYGSDPWRSAAVSDSCAVVVDQHSEVFFVDRANQRLISAIRIVGVPVAAAATPRMFALTNADATRIWQDGEIALIDHPATAMALVDDAIALASGGVVTVFDLPAKKVRATWRVGGHIAALAQRPNGVWYAGNEHGLFALRDEPELIHEGDVRRIVVSPNGKRFALQRTESHVAVYAWDSFEPELRLTGPVDGLAFGFGTLIALSASGQMSEVDLGTGAKRAAR